MTWYVFAIAYLLIFLIPDSGSPKMVTLNVILFCAALACTYVGIRESRRDR